MKDRLILCFAENILHEWIEIQYRVLTNINLSCVRALTQNKKRNFILKNDLNGIIYISPAKQEISVLLIL